MNGFCYFIATSFKEIASETSRSVSAKQNDAMPLKKHLICVRWEDITTKELMTLHGVITNVARCVKGCVKEFFFTVLQGHIFKEENL
jgi:hypothetical protein